MHAPRRLAGYGIAILGTVALTLGLLPLRASITPLSKGFGFLIVVVVSAAIGGLGPGILAAFFGFLTFDFFFLPPYGTFSIGQGEYVVVLFVFLGLSILISALLATAAERAKAAEARQDELRTLQALSAELVALVPGPETYRLVLSRVLEQFGLAEGALYLQDPVSGELRPQVSAGRSPDDLMLRPEAEVPGQPVERLPLSVGGRVLGTLLLRGERRALTPAESRVLRAFCDQFALVLERDRLLHAATEAEVFRQTDRVRRSLLAAVSHDLRSPLAAIKASVTDLLEQSQADRGVAESSEALRSINDESDRLAAMIANLLDMYRIEEGILRAHVQTVDLAEIFSASVDRIQHQWPELNVSSSIPANASIVRADPVFLDRVVTNLLDNAAKAARDVGNLAVQVEARTSDARTTVRIIDHGLGVPQGIRGQVFFPFYQVTKREPQIGTGLGLAIGKGFLALMKGEIWIEDTPGGGATFAFSLPNGGRSR